MKKLQHTIRLVLAIIAFAPICQIASAQTLSDEAVISVLSCSPGQPLYFHYGHTALRVQDPAMRMPDSSVQAVDWTFNYGIFDFNQPGFYLKFVKGETDYMLGLEYTSSFMLSAAYAERTVSYQPLLLTQEEKQTILDALMVNYQPENRMYRYNFVYDNCATRPWKIIRNALNLPEAEGMSGTTWRQACDHFSGRYSWGKYGINLLFGYEADREMSMEQSLFLPENLMNHLSQMGITDNEDIHPFTPRNSTFSTSPELLTILLVVLALLLGALDWYNARYHTWWLDVALYCLFFVLGLIVFVMYFFSSHPFVGSNMNILLLNPLWLVPLVLTCMPKTRHIMLAASKWVLGYIGLASIVLLAVGQMFHPILCLILAQQLRLYFIHKKAC